MAECCCGGNGKTTLIYACSGAANTGLLADQVARSLMNGGSGKMTCLSALGAELSGFLKSAEAADRNVVLDGCPVACGRKIFERLGLPFTQYVMTDFGVEKGKTEITTAITGDVTRKIAESLSECGC